MHRILVPIITFGLFCMLAGYSQGYVKAHPVRTISEHYGSEVTIKRGSHKRQSDKAAVIAEIWGITPEEVNQPIRIWGE